MLLEVNFQLEKIKYKILFFFPKYKNCSFFNTEIF